MLIKKKKLRSIDQAKEAELEQAKRAEQAKKQQSLMEQAGVDEILDEMVDHQSGSNGNIMDFLEDKPQEEFVIDEPEQNIPNIPSEEEQLASYLSQEELEEKAQALIEEKADQMLTALEQEILSQKQKTDQQIQDLLSQAQADSSMILNEANEQANIQKQELDSAFAQLEEEQKKFVEAVELERKAAYEEAMQSADIVISELVGILTGFHKYKEQILLEAKEEILPIAFDVAKQILHYEVQQNENLTGQQLLYSIQKVINSKGMIQVYLNEADMAQKDELETLLSQVLDPNTRVIFMTGEQVDAGSCIINTQGGRLDCSFKTQLQIIKLSFERFLGKHFEQLEESNVEYKEDKEIVEEGPQDTVQEPIQQVPNQDELVASHADELVKETIETSDIDSKPVAENIINQEQTVQSIEIEGEINTSVETEAITKDEIVQEEIQIDDLPQELVAQEPVAHDSEIKNAVPVTEEQNIELDQEEDLSQLFESEDSLEDLLNDYEEEEKREQELIPEAEFKEEEIMPNPQTNKANFNEPTDEELMKLEDDVEVDLDIDADLEDILADVLSEEEKAVENPSPDNKDEAFVDNSESLEAEENFMQNDEVTLTAETDTESLVEEEIDLDDELEVPLFDDQEVEATSKDDKEPNVDEDGNEFVEFDEFASDENFSDEGQDERFPEY